MGVSAVATRRAESAFGVADVAGLLAASVQPLDRSLPAGSAPNRCLRHSVSRGLPAIEDALGSGYSAGLADRAPHAGRTAL